MALLALSAPFIEPLLTSATFNQEQALVGAAVGVVFFSAGLILDHERSDCVDPYVYLMIVAAVVAPLALVVAFLAHKERLEDERTDGSGDLPTE